MHKSVPLTGKRPRGPETGVKIEQEFPFGAIRPEKNRTTYSVVPLLPEIYHRNDQRSLVPFTFQPVFRFVNGKQPLSLSLGVEEGRGRG